MFNERRKDFLGRAKFRIAAECEKGRAQSFQYISLDREAGPTEVRCKITGMVLKKLRPVRTMEIEQDAGGRTVITELCTLGETSEYCEIEISFDDGSKHVSPISVAVVDRLSLDDLETVYSADLEQWRLEEELNMGSVDWRLMADRHPVSYKRIR